MRSEHRAYRNAAVVIVIAAVMAGIFATTYTLALGRARPRHIPAAIVGSTARASGVATALNRETGGGLTFRPYPSATAAEAALDRQTIYAALIAGQGRPRLLIASAAGASVARVLDQAAAQVPPALAGAPSGLRVVDLHPLPAGDPQGLGTFYVTLAASIVGFLVMFQLRLNAAGLSLRGWLACIAALAALVGLVVATVADLIVGSLHGPLLEVWGVLAVEVAVAALFCSAMIVLIGRWAIIPVWLLFIALGNSSSGGAVAPPLLPALFAFFSRILPPGATVEIIRSAVYFTNAQHVEPFVVQAIWLGCSLGALLLFVRLRHRTPAG